MIVVPENLRAFAKRFSEPLYLVGGYVRDGLDGLVSPDIDICSALSADEVGALLGDTGHISAKIKRDTGTVGIRLEDGTEWQYTAFRKDVYTTGHTPIAVLKATMEEDAARRDFKANAVYYDIVAEKIVDPLGGVKDIESKLLTTTRPPERVFGEDGLRLMRLARIAAQTGYSVPEEVVEGARKNAFRIKEIACERILVELEKILHADKVRGIPNAPRKGLELLRAVGIFEYVLPELKLSEEDWEKTLSAVEKIDEENRSVALFHRLDENSLRFVLSWLRYPNNEIRYIENVVNANREWQSVTDERSARLFILRRYKYLSGLTALYRAEEPCGAEKAALAESVLEQMKAEGLPLTVGELGLNTGDFPPKEELPLSLRGEALQSLLEYVGTHPEENRQEIKKNYLRTYRKRR